MAEFPVTKPEFIVPSCVNLSTYIQGMSDYEVRCYYSQLVQQWANEWAQMQTEWGTQQEAFESFKTYVNGEIEKFQSWFDNLDVQNEIDNKIDEMASDGTFLNIIQSTVNSQTQAATDAWLQENMTPGAGAPALDSSLTLKNAAAQSAATGSAINKALDYTQRGVFDGLNVDLASNEPFTESELEPLSATVTASVNKFGQAVLSSTGPFSQAVHVKRDYIRVDSPANILLAYAPHTGSTYTYALVFSTLGGYLWHFALGGDYSFREESPQIPTNGYADSYVKYLGEGVYAISCGRGPWTTVNIADFVKSTIAASPENFKPQDAALGFLVQTPATITIESMHGRAFIPRGGMTTADNAVFAGTYYISSSSTLPDIVPDGSTGTLITLTNGPSNLYGITQIIRTTNGKVFERIGQYDSGTGTYKFNDWLETSNGYTPPQSVNVYYAVGDSLTAGSYSDPDGTPHAVTNAEWAWPKQIAGFAGCSVTNLGVPGITSGGALTQVIPSISSDASLVTIMLGTNDYGQNVQLGKYTDTSGTTTMANIYNIVKSIYNIAPSARIIIVCPWNCDRMSGSQETGYSKTAANSAGWSLENLHNQLKQFCDKYSIEYLDLLHDGPVSDFTLMQVCPDGVHPLKDYYAVIARRIYAAIM